MNNSIYNMPSLEACYFRSQTVDVDLFNLEVPGIFTRFQNCLYPEPHDSSLTLPPYCNNSGSVLIIFSSVRQGRPSQWRPFFFGFTYRSPVFVSCPMSDTYSAYLFFAPVMPLQLSRRNLVGNINNARRKPACIKNSVLRRRAWSFKGLKCLSVYNGLDFLLCNFNYFHLQRGRCKPTPDSTCVTDVGTDIQFRYRS